MAIDFSFPPELELLRQKVREFIEGTVRPIEENMDESNRSELVSGVIKMRQAAQEAGLWLPHMPEEWGGMGLGHVAMAAVSAEAAKTRFGPFALNAQAPDEGNMHTLLHWATDEQKEKYLRPLCDGRIRSCFAMTEPEVAGSDPTLIQTRAVQDGDEWVINGHKWFISGARGAQFAILIARTEDDPELPQAANTRVPGRHPERGLGDRARRRDHVRRPQPLRDPHHEPAGAELEDARRPRPGAPARPGAARAGAARPLHALDRPGRDRARHDGGPLARTASPTARCWRRSRASSG